MLWASLLIGDLGLDTLLHFEELFIKEELGTPYFPKYYSELSLRSFFIYRIES